MQLVPIFPQVLQDDSHYLPVRHAFFQAYARVRGARNYGHPSIAYCHDETQATSFIEVRRRFAHCEQFVAIIEMHGRRLFLGVRRRDG